MEEYYYYDEDGGDEEGEVWETALESAYANAKSIMNTSPEECAAGLHSVVCDDPIGGRWTFKALKMLARLSLRTKAYEDMLKYYNRVANFRHEDINNGALQKAMMKFMDEAQRVPVEYFERVLQITIEASSKNMRAFGKLWFNAKLKHATLSLEANNLDVVLEEMDPVVAWCKEEDQFSFKKSAQLFLSYALLLEVYTKKNDFKRIRDTFLLAISIVNTIPPSRVAGSVLECGGKMYMHIRDWSSAFRCFSVAFRNYNESGDPRRIECLKYLVLTCMLSGSTIDPFATHETKNFEDTAEILPMAKLMKAFTDNDVQEFLNVVEEYKETFKADPVIYMNLDLVLEELRLQSLVAYVAPYERLYMKRLEDVLVTNSDEVMRLCVRATMRGILNASLDDREDVIIVTQREREVVGQESERLQALRRWSAAILELNEKAKKTIGRIV
ncbi:putative proteasome regulatory non-ATPase subunit 6 [Trypanosoma theileri]|uniref:Putative proteasome regulatory non-ATPase subunit 6 n=1 Tax=Trypanosoma theileri TaxID=67003 RepID=A0A1X0NY12_9TRYP|nr:putative proteasome regulatory non-ATPase subunit 6 [Trypanosoma theileri]ORC89586.1 putative proteasome regulatory non-ATPase subunit 6 [Trypanosoma theileri]